VLIVGVLYPCSARVASLDRSSLDQATQLEDRPSLGTNKLPEMSLQRVKRSAEAIIYGNHQNAARVKKAGPIPALAGVEGLMSHNSKQDNDDVEHNEKVQAVVEAMMSPPTAPNNPAPNNPAPNNPAPVMEEPVAVEENLVSDQEKPVAEVEDALENKLEDAAVQSQQEEQLGSLLPASAGASEEQREQEMLQRIMLELEETNPAALAKLEAEYEQEYPDNYDYPYYGTNNYQRRKRSVNNKPVVAAEDMGAVDTEEDASRLRRSVKKLASRAVVAEDMGAVEAAEEANSRTKRDLADYYYEDEAPVVQVRDSPLQVRDSPLQVRDSPLASAYVQSMLQQEPVQYDYEEQEPESKRDYDYNNAIEEIMEEAAEEAAEEALEEEQRHKEMEQLELEYMLLQSAIKTADEELEVAAQKRAAPMSNAPIQDEYQEIIHNGQPGIFFPVKRQYLSMVPGFRKRSADMYPFSEPDTVPWEALVQQSQIEKRNQEAMYDRLYSLAQELRGESQYRKK